MLIYHNQEVEEIDENNVNINRPCNLILAIITIILPPLAVIMHTGKFNTHSMRMASIYTLCFWIPGK